MKVRALVAVAFAAVFALVLAGAAVADDVTLKGTIVCAKCRLKKADAQECQNVLLVPGKDGKDTEYYLAKSAAADEIGEVCMSKKKVVVTGSVSEKDGRQWVTAASIVDVEG